MGRVIALANPKGGCGKTTVCVNLAAGLARQNRQVLVVDFDPQGHASLSLGVEPMLGRPTVYEVLSSRKEIRCSFEEARCEIGTNIDLLPADESLENLVAELEGQPDAEERLLILLGREAAHYDYILIDTPPRLDILTVNALRAAREVIAPVDASRFCQSAVKRMNVLATGLAEKYRHDLLFHAITSNFDNRPAFSRMMIEEQRENFPGSFLRSILHVSSKVREAAYCGQPIVQYAPHSRATKEFHKLASEVLSMENKLTRIQLEEAVPDQAMHPSLQQQEVQFRFRSPFATEVAVVGSFNSWRSDLLKLEGPDEQGYWHAAVALPPGEHRYKFLIDGNSYSPDPENPIQENDGFGGLNSIIEI